MAGPRLTSRGLESSTAAAATLSAVQWAAAAGTADVVTAAFTPKLTALTDGLTVGVRHTLSNATTTPSLNTDGLGAHTIVKGYGVPLEPGDIPAEALYRYHASDGTWVLMNPQSQFRVPTAEWAEATGTADAITCAFDPTLGELDEAQDGLLVGVRAGAANATTAPTFSPDTFTARIIKKLGAQALAIGDIYGAGHEMLLRFHYDATTPWWELLNPATSAIAAAEQPKSKYLTGTAAGTDVDTAQPWFPTAGAVSVAAGAAYKFKGRLFLTRAAGTTSHTTAILFGGTATITAINYIAKANENDDGALLEHSAIKGAAATAVVVKAASTSATEVTVIEVEGLIVINAAGTLIPQFKYSVAPGGVPTVGIGTFFELQPLTSNPKGTWA
ncbi:MAG: hypothetical protein AB7F22_07805 [Reyranella sp.]|uniref:hypothetical protein n=1 Tax=Reyranella sp. TaxID=1929291 RepID=UPI003D13609E